MPACIYYMPDLLPKPLGIWDSLNFDEPFLSLKHQGVILGPDGQKMSKSKGNTISPDDCIKEYGADVFRMYLMFGFDYTEGGAWSDDGIKSMSKFVDRIERYISQSKEAIEDTKNNTKTSMDTPEKDLNYVRNFTIKSVLTDTNKFQFNTSIARMMEFTNELSKYLKIKN